MLVKAVVNRDVVLICVMFKSVSQTAHYKGLSLKQFNTTTPLNKHCHMGMKIFVPVHHGSKPGRGPKINRKDHHLIKVKKINNSRQKGFLLLLLLQTHNHIEPITSRDER